MGPDVRDICYATQNRQTAVRELCQFADVIIVVGARNSSNSNRLREIGDEAGIPSYLVADSSEIDPEWVRNAAVVGVTAGASAPEVVVEEVVQALSAIAPSEVSALDGPAETVSFRLPGGAHRIEPAVAVHQLGFVRIDRGHTASGRSRESAPISSGSIWRAASATRSS